MKKKLKAKILKRVYMFETKRTLVELIVRIGLLLLVIIAGLLLVIDIVQQLMYQQTLDLLQLFQEDIETIRMYIGEVVSTFYEELPKFESIIVIILLIVFIILVLIFIKNFGNIRNRVRALKKYWLNR